jgi:hypothetical protein
MAGKSFGREPEEQPFYDLFYSLYEATIDKIFLGNDIVKLGGYRQHQIGSRQAVVVSNYFL